MTLPPLDPSAPRIFLDSSVLISGMMSQRGASYAILLLAELRLIRIIVCPYTKGNRAQLSVKSAGNFAPLSSISCSNQLGTLFDPSSDEVLPLISLIPAKDAPVLAAAINSKPDRLVTLDTAHFIRVLPVSQQSGMLICTPGDLVREIRSLLARGFGRT